jgi:glutamate carboxypeptidase
LRSPPRVGIMPRPMSALTSMRRFATPRRALVPAALVALLLVPAPASAAPAALSRTERTLAAAVDRGAPAALALIERAVNVNSGTMNLDGVREVGRMLEPELGALGFTTRWVPGAEWNRAGHLIATREGRAGSLRVLLIGHLDTVFESDSPFQRFERLDDSTARGPGVCDMKGGDVVMLLALRALKEAGVIDRLALTVVLSGDEEKSGEPLALARRDLREAAKWADVAIGFEDGAGDPRTAIVARRGSTGWRLDVRGTPAHSSQIFRADIGNGAIYEAARILTAFRDSLSSDSLLTANPGLIVGGTKIAVDPEASRGTAFGKSNVIAESTTVTGDLRAVSLEQRENAKAVMRRIVAATAPHAAASIEFDDGYPPLSPSAGNTKLLAIYDRASRDLGFGPVVATNPRLAGAADVSFCDGEVDMALDGVGLMGTGGHTVRETADLRTLPIMAKRMAVTLYRLSAAKPGHGTR